MNIYVAIIVEGYTIAVEEEETEEGMNHVYYRYIKESIIELINAPRRAVRAQKGMQTCMHSKRKQKNAGVRRNHITRYISRATCWQDEDLCVDA